MENGQRCKFSFLRVGAGEGWVGGEVPCRYFQCVGNNEGRRYQDDRSYAGFGKVTEV